MPARMPTSVELVQIFGKGGAAGYTRGQLRSFLDADRAGRLMRQNQLEDHCVVTHDVSVEFSDEVLDAGGQILTGWLTFGRIAFTKEPAFTTGPKGSAQEGETPELNEDGSNYDPEAHIRIPAMGMNFRWKMEGGLYRAAKVLLFAVGSVPDGYRATVSCVWTGPAIRIA